MEETVKVLVETSVEPEIPFIKLNVISSFTVVVSIREAAACLTPELETEAVVNIFCEPPPPPGIVTVTSLPLLVAVTPAPTKSIEATSAVLETFSSMGLRKLVRSASKVY